MVLWSVTGVREECGDGGMKADGRVCVCVLCTFIGWSECGVRCVSGEGIEGRGVRERGCEE